MIDSSVLVNLRVQNNNCAVDNRRSYPRGVLSNEFTPEYRMMELFFAGATVRCSRDLTRDRSDRVSKCRIVASMVQF